MCQRAATRQLAPGDLLGSRQTVQNWIAESRAAIEAARLLVLHAAWTIDSRGIAQAREAISLIKFHVAGVMQEVIDRASGFDNGTWDQRRHSSLLVLPPVFAPMHLR